MRTEVTDAGSVGSSSLDESSLIEDEDFQLVNTKHKNEEEKESVSANNSRRSSLAVSDLAGNVVFDHDAEDEGSEQQKGEVVEKDGKDSEVEAVLYGPEAQRNALKNLVLFSVLLFTLPMAVIYASYVYFLEHLHLPRDRAALYAGLLGVASVLVIVVAFVLVAYREEQYDEKRLQQLGKSACGTNELKKTD